MTLAVAEALSPNTPNLDMTLAVAGALSPNTPNLDMTLAVAEALSPNKPNLDMTLAIAEALILGPSTRTMNLLHTPEVGQSRAYWSRPQESILAENTSEKNIMLYR